MIPVPLLISGGIGIFAVIIIVPILMRRIAGKRTAEYYLFNREMGVEHGKGENLADLVIHPSGGYVVRPDTTIHARYGRATFERGPEAWRRKVKPVSVIPAGFSAAIRIQDDGSLDIDPLTLTEFNERERMAAEIAVSEAAVRAGAADFIAKILALSAGALILPIIGLVALIASRS